MEFEYEVCEKTEFHIIGMVLDDIPFMQGPKHIPELWESFVPRIAEVEQSSVKPYGEFGAMKDFDQETKMFKYLAGLPVGSDALAPDGMEMWTVPAQTYIVIKCHLNTLG